MTLRLARSIIVVAFMAALCAVTARPAAADQTTTEAMASIGYLAGTWHCTGGGPDTDDTYTLDKNWFHDTDSTGDVTSGTFDAKRQKWVIFVMGADGGYSVNEGTIPSPNHLDLSIPYPAGVKTTYKFEKVSDTQFTLGAASCTKK